MKNNELEENDLKKICKVFDLNLLSAITLQQPIKNTNVFSKCSNLRFLSLKNCNLKFLNFPNDLEKLILLDVRQNNIIELKGISKLKNLLVLRIEGNLISDLKEIESLKNLFELKYLSFQNFDRSLENPICALKNYKKTVIKFLSKIENLDYYALHLENEKNDFNFESLIEKEFEKLNKEFKEKSNKNIFILEKAEKTTSQILISLNKNSSDLDMLDQKYDESELKIKNLLSQVEEFSI